MNHSTAQRAVTLIVAMTPLLACCAISMLPGAAADEEDHTIRPGIGLGIVKLGMDKDEVKKTAGNIDGSYSLPSGVRVDFSEWKEPKLKRSPNMRFFYAGTGKVIQINSAAPVPATADGISCSSSFAKITSRYKGLKCLRYRVKDARIDYYDDVKRGIAFEYIKDDGAAARQLYAIIMHLPGQPVLADADEQSLAIKAK